MQRAELPSPERQSQGALQQAEGYRNFLASLTGLLTAVFVLKGQEDLSNLGGCVRWTVLALLVEWARWPALVVCSPSPGR